MDTGGLWIIVIVVAAPLAVVLWDVIRPDLKCLKVDSNYFRQASNWVAVLTLFFVAAYTGISYCSMQVGRDSFTTVQRAFVTVASFDSSVRFGSGFAKDTKYWWFVPNIKNSGNTPTQNLHYYVASTCPVELSMGLGPRMLIECNFTKLPSPHDPDEIKNSPTAQKYIPSSIILGPQNRTSIGGVGITEASLQKIVDDGSPLFEYGIVYYNDIFPGSQQHVTKTTNARRTAKSMIGRSLRPTGQRRCLSPNRQRRRRQRRQQAYHHRPQLRRLVLRLSEP